MGAPRSGRSAALLAWLLLLLLLPGPLSAHASRGLSLGFFDGVYATDERDPWLERTVAVDAQIVKIDIGWPAPDTAARPHGFDARDPANPHYDFARADASIAAAGARGLQVIAGFTGAPRWAEGSGRPAGAAPGTFKPSPRALADYGAALARRYSGSFPDPARAGRALPRVRAFQLWNEPNLSLYLSPQWQGSRPASPALYRAMLNGFYGGVKSVDPRALVVTAGTGPFGDRQPGGGRIQPARFWRELLCLRRTDAGLRGSRCPAPAHFDVLAHHPYSVGPPRRRALNDDDVSIPDLGKLARLLRAAERSGRALPRERHRLWVTEISFDSKPPDPGAVPVATHARWLEETLYLLWREGVDTITWFQVRDEPPAPSYAASVQSGVYFIDGRPKPAALAFRFPFVAERAKGGGLRAWGRSPRAGALVIERLRGGSWHVLRSLRVGRNDTFLARLPAAAAPGDRLRARVAGETSLTWLAR